MNKPQIWHYGLNARYWGEHETAPGPEGTFYKELIERSGQLALDLGCEGDRLLLPLSKAGFDLDNTTIRQIRVRQYRNNEPIAEEIHTQKLDDYNKNELVLSLNEPVLKISRSMVISRMKKQRQITKTLYS